MNGHIELGRIAGIPIILDMMFVLLLVLVSYPYFTTGNTQEMSIGFVVIFGFIVSILLHELGHALAGRLYKTNVTHIRLTGLGGVAQFEKSLPKSVVARTVIYLAGPAANLLLWKGLGLAAGEAMTSGVPMLGIALATLASANFYFLFFNLLPAYPLDGGHTLDAWIGGIAGGRWAVRIVASLGLLVAVWFGFTALQGKLFWTLFLAFFLFETNSRALQSVGGWKL